jgi:hypothetical protein
MVATLATRLASLEAKKSKLMAEVHALDGAITEVKKLLKKKAARKERRALLQMSSSSSSSDEDDATPPAVLMDAVPVAEPAAAEPAEAELVEDVEEAEEAEEAEAEMVEPIEAEEAEVAEEAEPAVVAVAAMVVGTDVCFFSADDFAPFTIKTLPKHGCKACLRGTRGMHEGTHGKRLYGSCLRYSEEGVKIGRPSKCPRV